MPSRELCTVVYLSAPHLTHLLVRPTTAEGAHSQYRQAFQEPSQTTPTLQRWDACKLFTLSSLQSLSISGLSVEGVRDLQTFLPFAARLSQLTVDSQFVDDALLVHIAEVRNLRRLLIKSSGTKVKKKRAPRWLPLMHSGAR